MKYYSFEETTSNLIYESTLSPRGMRAYGTYQENYSEYLENYIHMRTKKNNKSQTYNAYLKFSDEG
jgi:hypothetical protein